MLRGWLDQPWVSEHCSGPVITLGIEPTHPFNERSGMASSTRKTAARLFAPGPLLSSASWPYFGADPALAPSARTAELAAATDTALENSAWLLFCADNPPGTVVVSGAQDAIGLVYPGLACAHFDGKHWPHRIDRCMDPDVLHFAQQSLRLIPLAPRVADYDVLATKRIEAPGCQRLADAARLCWQALLARDVRQFGRAVRDSFEAQVELFPAMMTADVRALLDQVAERPDVLGWKLSGAGGGGYLIVVTDSASDSVLQPGELRLTVRR